MADDDGVEMRRRERGAEQRGDRRVRVAVQRHVPIAPRLAHDPGDDIGDVFLLPLAEQAEGAAAHAAPADVGIHSRVAVIDVHGGGGAAVGLHVDDGRITTLPVVG
jgi:hypothetical protein